MINGKYKKIVIYLALLCCMFMYATGQVKASEPFADLVDTTPFENNPDYLYTNNSLVKYENTLDISDYVTWKDREVGWGHAYSEYRLCNPDFSISNFSSIVLSSLDKYFNPEKGEIIQDWLKRKVINSYDDEIKVSHFEIVTETINYTDNSTGNITYENITYEKEIIDSIIPYERKETEWASIESFAGLELPKGYCFDFRVEADFEMVNGSAKIDNIPQFLNINFTQYDWWNVSFGYKKQVNITGGASTIYNFTAFIKVPYDAHMQINYTDLRFIDWDESTSLDYEIEYFNSTEADIWVRIPELNTTINKIYMYYGNLTTISSGENIAGVWNWNNKHNLVYHLTSNVLDSAGNTNISVTGGTPDSVVGKFGNAYFFDSASNEYFGAQDRKETDIFTLSFWINGRDFGVNQQFPFGYKPGGGGSDSGDWSVMIQAGAGESVYLQIESASSGNNYNINPNSFFNENQWYHIVVTRNGTAYKAYVDANNTYSQTTVSDKIKGFDGIGTMYYAPAYYTGSLNGTLDNIQFLNGTVWSQDEVSRQFQNANSSYVVFGAEQVLVSVNIDWLSQTPANITTSNLFGDNNTLQVYYNITADNPINTSSVKYYSKTNSSLNDIRYFVNGTSYEGYQEGAGTSNASSIWQFLTGDNRVYPATYNLDENIMETTQHTQQSLANESYFIKMRLFNVSLNKSYNQFEIMANSTGTFDAQLYYCNSSYSTGNVLTSAACVNFYTLPYNATFNHTHRTPPYSGHIVVPFSFNLTTGLIGGVKVTETSYFLLRGSSDGLWKYYTVPNISRTDTMQLTDDSGASWSNQAFTLDSHLHQYKGDEIHYYYVCANDTTGAGACSDVYNQTISADILPPTAPDVYSPNASLFIASDIVNINYTAAISPNGNNITTYNISILYSNQTYYDNIVSNNYPNLSYAWDSTGMPEGNFLIKVEACDDLGKCSYGLSEVFSFIAIPYISVLNITNKPIYRDINANCNFTIVKGSFNYTLNVTMLINDSIIFNNVTNQTTSISGNYVFNSSLYNVGYELICLIYAEDTMGYNATSNDTVIVQNRIPVAITNITPSNPYSDDDLIGFCNATDNDTAPVDNITYNYSWYKYVDTTCYQESANVKDQTGIDGNCGQDYSGTYFVTNQSNVGYFYINYSKPQYANSSIWRVKDYNSSANDIINITVPDSCFQQSVLQLRLLGGVTVGYNRGDCYNGTAWIIIRPYANFTQTFTSIPTLPTTRLYDGDWNTFITYDSNDGWGNHSKGAIFEEGIYWIFNQSYFDQNISVANLSSGNTSVDETWTFNCLAYDGYNYSLASNTTVSIIDSTPIINNFTILNEPIYKLFNVTCQYDILSQFDENITLEYNFTTNGVLKSNGTLNLTGINSYLDEIPILSASTGNINNPLNIIDGNLSTYAYGTATAGAGYLNMTFRRPGIANRTQTKIIYKNSAGTQSLTIPEACWDNEVLLKAYTNRPAVGLSSTKLYCHNGTGFQEITISDGAPYYIYYAAINWSGDLLYSSNTITLTPGNYNSGNNVTCNAKFISSHGDVSYLSDSTIIANYVPTASARIYPELIFNQTMQYLYCNSTDLDQENGTFTANYYINGILNQSVNSTSVPAGQETLVATVAASLTEVDDNITLGCIFYDGINYSAENNDTNQVIESLHSLTYSNFTQYNGTNYTRVLNYAYNITCPNITNGTFKRYINGINDLNYTLTCNNSAVSYNKAYQHAYEGGYNISFDLVFSNSLYAADNLTAGFAVFVSDLYSPNITELNFTVSGSGFETNNITTSINCSDTISPVLTYNETFNNDSVLYFVNATTGTRYTNSSLLGVNDINTLYGECSDFFSSTNDILEKRIYIQYFALIDELDNAPFDVTTVDTARLIFDNNQSLFDFIAEGNVTTVNFTSDETSKLRLELGYPDGTFITRFIDVSLSSNGRLCANEPNITHYEQIIIANTERPVIMTSLYANCLVVSDYTRFAYENALSLKAYTVSSVYTLNTFDENDVEYILANIDGTTASTINLDNLIFNRNAYNLDFIGDALSYFNNDTQQILTIYYENKKGDNDDAEVQITNMNTSTIIYTQTGFADPNSFQIALNYATYNVSNNTLFKIEVIKTLDTGSTETKTEYFNLLGKSGIFTAGFGLAFAIALLFFGLTFTAVNLTFSYFGLMVEGGAFIILSLSVQTWFIVLMQAIVVIAMVYTIIIMINKNSPQVS